MSSQHWSSADADEDDYDMDGLGSQEWDSSFKAKDDGTEGPEWKLKVQSWELAGEDGDRCVCTLA